MGQHCARHNHGDNTSGEQANPRVPKADDEPGSCDEFDGADDIHETYTVPVGRCEDFHLQLMGGQLQNPEHDKRCCQ